MLQEPCTISVLDSGLRFPQLVAVATHEQIRDELIRQLDSGDLKPKQVSDCLGIPSPRVAELRNRKRRVQPDEMHLLARLLKLEGAPPIPALPTPTPPADAEIVPIQKLDLSLSMGPGTLIDGYVEAEPVSFDLAFIRAITRTPPDKLKLVTGIGDSMYPTLNWGDAIMVDTNDRQLARQDGIYWIDLYGAAGLKRLRTVGRGRVLVISDNRDVPDQEVDAKDLRIEGRAIWVARGL